MKNLFFKIFVPIHTWILKTFKGRVMGTMGPAPVLLLSVPGRKSGQLRTSPLLYVRDNGRYIVIASKGGSVTNPDWFENLTANGSGTVQIGEDRIPVAAEVVQGPERERLWNEAARVYPAYNDYAKKTAREIPVVALTPGSPAAV
jgi:deazaflavin-dependent oxidoreductase (nitroreductase family)